MTLRMQSAILFVPGLNMLKPPSHPTKNNLHYVQNLQRTKGTQAHKESHYLIVKPKKLVRPILQNGHGQVLLPPFYLFPDSIERHLVWERRKVYDSHCSETGEKYAAITDRKRRNKGNGFN